MSLIGLRVISERREIKGDVLSNVETLLKRDIEWKPDTINLSEKDNVGLNKAKKVKEERKHAIYSGKQEDKLLLSKALEKFTFDKWEKHINWYRKHPPDFFGKSIIDDGGYNKKKLTTIKHKLARKVRIFMNIFHILTMIAINLFGFVVTVSHR